MNLKLVQVSGRLEMILAGIIVLVVGLALGQTVVNTIQSTLVIAAAPATEWNFTGYTAVTGIIPIIPLIYYAGILVTALAMFYGSTKVK